MLNNVFIDSTLSHKMSEIPRTPEPEPEPEEGSDSSIFTTRDQRIAILTLRNAAHYKLKDIADTLKLSLRQVQYACSQPNLTPVKRSGRPPKLSPEQIIELIAYVTHTKDTRRIPINKLPEKLGWTGIGIQAIKTALKNAGYRRYVALRKPPISERTRKRRLAWAEEHLSWSREQWADVLWSDETWVTAGRHRKTWVTRKQNEALDPTCILERVQRKSGWMFWGCFSGRAGKGPGLFWEKDWGSINGETYCQHTVPIIDGWLRMHPGHVFMQDNAPGHASKDTLEEFTDRHIIVITWPPFSPDLNPIETVWNKMKDYISHNCPEHASYDRLRQAVKEAWDLITDEYLAELLDTMQQRCMDVIKARGMHTRW